MSLLSKCFDYKDDYKTHLFNRKCRYNLTTYLCGIEILNYRFRENSFAKKDNSALCNQPNYHTNSTLARDKLHRDKKIYIGSLNFLKMIMLLFNVFRNWYGQTNHKFSIHLFQPIFSFFLPIQCIAKIFRIHDWIIIALSFQ